MMLLSYTIIEIHLRYDGAVDIQIWAPLTRSQCKVSDIQVTVEACGPLVSFYKQNDNNHCVHKKPITLSNWFTDV